MSDGPDGGWSVERVRAVTARVGVALKAVDPDGSAHLASAVGLESGDAEALLVMRSALIATRSQWEALEAKTLVSAARAAIAAGKRLAIDLA